MSIIDLPESFLNTNRAYVRQIPNSICVCGHKEKDHDLDEKCLIMNCKCNFFKEKGKS